MIVVNLFGEPSSGKSLTAGGLYYELGVNGVNAEIVPEIAKIFAWESPKDSMGNPTKHPIFGQQIYMLGEQNRGIERIKNQVQVAIMECPLLMTAIYAPEKYFQHFEPLVLEQFHDYNNLNFVLQRNHPFQKEGRVHDEEEAKEVKEKLYSFLNKHNIQYIPIKTHRDINKEIAKIVIQKLNDTK